MKQFILIGVLFILSFNVYSLSSVRDMSSSELIYEVYSNHNNNTEIILELANRYNGGWKGALKDRSKAAELYERLVKRGSIEAIRALGSLYTIGVGVNEDVSRAGELYEQGLHIAMRQTAEKKLNLSDSYNLKAILNDLFSLHEKGKYSSELFLDKGLFLYQKVYEGLGEDRSKLYEKAQAGDIEALLKLSSSVYGDVFYAAEGRFILMKAAELGSVEAMVKLANTYRYEFNYAPSKRDTMKRSVALYKQAANQGSVEAMEALAHIYRYGVGSWYTDIIRKNIVMARTFYIRAVELGSLTAMEALVNAYENGGLGMKPNSEKAIKYYAMILETELSPQEKEIETLVKRRLKLKEKSITRLRELASNGSVEANYHLGRFYRDGLKITFLKKLGKDSRFFWANILFGYYKRNLHLPANPALAALLFERALEKGHEKAGEALRQLVPEDISIMNPFACRAAFAG